MKMKTIGVKYLRAKNKEVADGLDLVVQTEGMQLVVWRDCLAEQHIS